MSSHVGDFRDFDSTTSGLSRFGIRDDRFFWSFRPMRAYADETCGPKSKDYAADGIGDVCLLSFFRAIFIVI